MPWEGRAPGLICDQEARQQATDHFPSHCVIHTQRENGLEPRAMDKVSFGHEDVAPQEKTRRVGEVFSSVAARYDLMNDLMSGGQHRLWKQAFVRKVRPRKGGAILDMAGGTGDIAFRLAAARAAVTVADINPDMLGVGI